MLTAASRHAICRAGLMIELVLHVMGCPSILTECTMRNRRASFSTGLQERFVELPVPLPMPREGQKVFTLALQRAPLLSVSS